MTTGKNKVQIAPSILSADFARLGDEVQAAVSGGADLIHVDVMDGHFVPNITIGPLVVSALKKITAVPLDVHLMIENPDQYVDAFIGAGSDFITVHAETGYHLQRTLDAIRRQKVRAGLALNPATTLNVLEHLWPDVDLILLMSVNPGFGNQKFIPQVWPKIQQLRQMINDKTLDILIEVDGGVKIDNAVQTAQAGADILVAGSAVFDGKNPQENVRQLKLAVNGG
ncbi:MAG: ribulose-phosphate 3-epimerase [Candidatus Schekmanbacteria bacterium]|nr:ribulose-phosphate 3-epimerase [Candidatus Schekmanbacteria bacterium]